MCSQMKSSSAAAVLFFAACAAGIFFAASAYAYDFSSYVYESPSHTMNASSETAGQWQKPDLSQFSFQTSETFLQDRMAALADTYTFRPAIQTFHAVDTTAVAPAISIRQAAMVTPVLTAHVQTQVFQMPGQTAPATSAQPVSPAPAAPVSPAPGPAVSPVIPATGYVPATAPQINTNNAGEWTYSGVDPAVLAMVRSGSQQYVGQEISFTAGDREFSGVVMAAEPNAMAVRADNSAWFGLVTTSSDALTIFPLTLFDEGTGDLSSVEVLEGGTALRMGGTDYDGEYGTVEFDIVTGKPLVSEPSAQQLSELVLSLDGVVYELVPNSANGLNLMRINSISCENGTIVIND
ncbi:MAG: hypothetical protein KBC23_00740 [Candidatus Omnitrophica bacterium]|nr:hypothetical protein [Candidatus Omnitrophota bacterium]